MRVAYVVSKFPSLSQTFVLNQITGLIDRGIDVDIYASYRDEDGLHHAAVDAYALQARARYPSAAAGRDPMRRARVAMLLGRAVARSGGSPEVLRRLFRHGREDAHRVRGFAHLGAGGPRTYDGILCHFGTEGLLGSALRNIGLLRGPLLTAFHGYDLSRVPRTEGESMYDRLFLEGDLFLPVTEFWKARLVQLGCPAGKIVVHRMGVDCGRFAFTPRTIPSAGPVRVATVARLVEKKGVDYAMRAVAACIRAGLPIEYSIVGSGPLHAELAALAQALGTDRQIVLLGAQPHEEVSRLLASAHVLLAPSVTAGDGDMEGLPVALMEALASGLPVISTRHSGIPELVEDGITGLLAPERDVDALERALTRLAAEPDLYARIARAGRQRVEEDFNVDRLNDRLVDLFRRPSGNGLPRAA